MWMGPFPPAPWPLAWALGMGQQMVRRESPVGGRKDRASPAEEQRAPPHPPWEGGAAAPRLRMQDLDLLEREEERPLWGPSVQSWGVGVCPPCRQLPGPWAGAWEKRVYGSAAVPRALGALWPACQDIPGAKAAVARFHAYLLGVGGWVRNCLASGAPWCDHLLGHVLVRQ